MVHFDIDAGFDEGGGGGGGFRWAYYIRIFFPFLGDFNTSVALIILYKCILVYTVV